MRKIPVIGTAVLVAGCLVGGVSTAAEQSGIPPETVADYLHSIIEADRTFYSIHVVERLQKAGGAKAAENWRAKKNVLPLPAQFLIESSELATKTGSKVRYRLISLWPINRHNAPATAVEKQGLETLQEHPERSVTGTVTIGGRPFFQAIYSDRAVTKSCIACHNAHPKSPKKDFQMHEMMGGLVIEIPLEK